MCKIELDYWDKELSLKGSFPDAIKNRIERGNLCKEFPVFILRYLEEVTTFLPSSRKKLPKVLDLGSGPLSQLNYGVEFKLIDLYAVDPLADEYKKLLVKYNIPAQKYDLIQCAGENLSKKFKENTFDFVWCHNALDHCQDPCKVFEEISKVAKPGAYIFILGWENEGKAMGYYGSHRHDIFFDWTIKKFKIKTRGEEIEKLLVNPELPLRFWDFNIQKYSEERTWIKGIWRKN